MRNSSAIKKKKTMEQQASVPIVHVKTQKGENQRERNGRRARGNKKDKQNEK